MHACSMYSDRKNSTMNFTYKNCQSRDSPFIA